jgi:phage terminase small subunit
MANLTPKQAKFVEEYLADLNATQAALRAGYSEKTAYSIGFENLRKPEIQEALTQRRKELQEANDLTPEKVIAELEKLAFASMDTYTKWGPHGVSLVSSDELPEGAAAAVAEVSETITDKSHNTRFKLHDKAGSLDKLLKYMQWKQEKEEVKEEVAELRRILEEHMAQCSPMKSGRNGHHQGVRY